MAVSRAMGRLLRIREMEEEQSQTALERAVGEQRRLELAKASAKQRERAGRMLLAASTATGELVDRVAGVEQVRSAQRHEEVLQPRLADAERMVGVQRQEFLAKRVERRQVESVVRKHEAEESVETERRTQRELDDWFLRQQR